MAFRPTLRLNLSRKPSSEGRDPQLEKAVELVLAKLKESPLTKAKRPPFPNYYKPELKEPAEGK